MSIRFSMILFALLFGMQWANAQEDVIILSNPSFEGIPHSGGSEFRRIPAWDDCGIKNFNRETPPDLHNSLDPNEYIADERKVFGVAKMASEGRTYLGMVARDNETYESITQRLDAPIQGGSCYSFSIDLCHSEVYISPYPKRDISKSYTEPIVLRIYGGDSYCGKRELLAESDRVSNTDWESYEFNFEPSQTHRFITLQAFYKTPVLIPYNGNILLDNASVITKIPCPNEAVADIAVVEVKDPVKTVITSPTEPTKPKVVKPKTPVTLPEDTKPSPVAKKPEINKELDRKTISTGKVLQINKLFFAADKATIDELSHQSLDEVVSFLRENDDVRVEVGGHTNGLPKHAFCDSLSTLRAKAVADYLIEQGIPSEQVEYKGYGKRKPIASNKTKAGRTKNQRVEIKILEFKD